MRTLTATEARMATKYPILEVPGVPGVYLLWGGNGVAIPLSPEYQKPISDGVCSCPTCKAQPKVPPMWDTLRLAQRHDGWRVHWPNQKLAW